MTDPTGTVPPMDDPSMRSASLSPEEEAALRKRVGLARCDWTYIAIDGRPYKCGLIFRGHESGLGGDHAFEAGNTLNGVAIRLLATLDAARSTDLACTCNNGDGTTHPKYHAKDCPIALDAARTPRETPDLDDGHKHVTIRIDKRARQELRARLFEADMRGVGYTDFILEAIKRSRPAPRETPDPPRGYVDGMYHLTATEYDRALRRAFEDGRKYRDPGDR